MKKDGQGGAKTIAGLNFEKKVDLLTLLGKLKHFKLINETSAGIEVHYEGKCIARCFKKYEFYNFLNENNVDWKKILSKRLLPDSALLLIVRETLFIIEVKYQQGLGSVDEKLQTCDFKRKQYLKLVSSMGIKVEYVYVLNDWFKQESYKDTLNYIHSVNCHYKFNTLPLAWLGLPNS